MNMMYGLTDIQSWTHWELGGYPWQQPERYRKHSPLTHVAKIKTPTLVLHARDDRRVPLPMGKAFYQALLANDVPTQMVIYPNEGHLIRQPRHRATSAIAGIWRGSRRRTRAMASIANTVRNLLSVRTMGLSEFGRRIARESALTAWLGRGAGSGTRLVHFSLQFHFCFVPILLVGALRAATLHPLVIGTHRDFFVRHARLGVSCGICGLLDQLE